MMLKKYWIWLCVLPFSSTFAQLPVARDTLSVIENNYVLKMPWGNGINYANLSSADLNFDGKKDVIAYDRINQFATGRFRCFLNVGNPGEIKYQASPELSYAFPPISNWAVLLDFNCDGYEDIFCSTSAGIKIYKNNGPPNLSFTLFKSLLYSDFNPAGTPSIGNLYASTIGVPGIADIDGDGDLDILTFSPLGVFAEYHKNLSKEKGYRCDSLIFERDDECWGKFSESTCEVDMNQCGAKIAHRDTSMLIDGKTYHAGACLTCLDSDNDGDQDLILGDISCNTVQYIYNGGSVNVPLMTDTTKLYPNYPAKSNTTQIKINNFPCTYYMDANNDGKKDLIATPNAPGSENFTSVWYYQNTSTTGTVNFQFVKNNFLQDEMIEVGQNSFPVILDYDADGLKDLMIGNYGYYSNAALKAQLTLYRNIGTAAVPVYSLISRDYTGLSAQNLNNAMCTVGDIDNDNDVDICIGTSSGQIHWLENTGGQGNPCNFSLFHNNPFTFTTTSAAAAPQLFDIDSDGKLDLLIGTKNGRIAYYKNIGSGSSPSFTLITDFFGGVDVKGNINLYGIDGYATPYFYTENNSIKLLVGSVNGSIFYYSVPAVITNTFNLITNSVNNYNEGAQSTVYFEDINNDGKRDLLVGNGGGGLSLFSSWSAQVGLDELSPAELNERLALFPNPAHNKLTIQLDKIDFKTATVSIYDLVGKEVMQQNLNANDQSIDMQLLNNGIYFVRVSVVTNQQSTSVTKKIIKD